MELVILAGGQGTRLKERLRDKPKPLIEVAHQPLLHYHLSLAKHFRMDKVHLLLGYGAQCIREYCADGSRWNVTIQYHQETTPLGTAGALLTILPQLPECFFVLYGDVFLDVNLTKMLTFHKQMQAAATLFLHPNDHPYDSDLVDIDEQKRILAFHPYPHNPDSYLANLVNAGLYIFEKSALMGINYTTGILDFGKHVFPMLLQKRHALYGYKGIEYIKDIGTPKRLDEVNADYLSGKVRQRSLDVLKSAIFLDRDGTINRNQGYIKSVAQFDLLPGVAQAIGEINLSQYLSVVITNQPVVARGEATISQLTEIHNKLDTLLGQHGAFVDALYYCPHHPDKGFAGECLEYKINCTCRKPEIALLQQAQADFNLNFATSWLIGDSTVDVECARRAGVKSILLRSGEGGCDRKFYRRPDFECVDLASAVKFILHDWPQLFAKAQSFAHVVKRRDLVLIGGLARSGKSCFATALKYALQEQKKSAVVVSLDSWLVNQCERNGVGVLSRYHLNKIEQFITDFLQELTPITIPFYDRFAREAYAEYITVDNSEDHILIIEGVVALLLSKLSLQRAALKVYVDCSVANRWARFCDEYCLRGWIKADIEREYQLREQDETPLVLESKAYAGYIIRGDL